MGSDTYPHDLLKGVYQAMETLPEVIWVLFASAAVLQGVQHSRLQCVLSDEIITPEEDPLNAVRRKKKSSLMVAIRALKRKKIGALVTAGSTGALVAASTLSLDRLPHVRRPALVASLPTEKKPVTLLDVGGNVSFKAPLLLQFAHMGAAYHRCMAGIENPRVGLLNIGIESKKGTQEIRAAYALLQAECEGFVGNVEARDVFNGEVDVVVTDGFSGNVFVKAAEGAARFLLKQIQSAVSPEKMATLRKQFDYSEYPGAFVCGVDGVVIKCHGNATPTTFFLALQAAHHALQSDLIAKLKSV